MQVVDSRTADWWDGQNTSNISIPLLRSTLSNQLAGWTGPVGLEWLRCRRLASDSRANEGTIGMAPRMRNSIEAVLGAWSDGPGPLHRKLTDALRHAIEVGYLAVDERLPSERELALRLAVSR